MPAMGRKIVRYVSFLGKVSAGFGNVSDIDLRNNQIVVHGSKQEHPVVVEASGIDETFD